MNELRTLVRNYRSGKRLREEVRDAFRAEIEAVRGRLRALDRELGLTAVRSKGEARVARELESFLSEADAHARTPRFPEALRAMQNAADHEETLEAILSARKEIERVEQRVLEVERFLGPVAFDSVIDWHVLLIRCRGYYEEERYEMARVLAVACGQLIESSIAVAPAEVPFPLDLSERIERQSHLSRWLESVCRKDAERTRSAAATIRRVLDYRFFELARKLIRDLEIANAAIEAFVFQVRLVAGDAARAPELERFLLQEAGDGIDWRGASARIVGTSIAEASQQLALRAHAGQNSQPVSGENA